MNREFYVYIPKSLSNSDTIWCQSPVFRPFFIIFHESKSVKTNPLGPWNFHWVHQVMGWVAQALPGATEQPGSTGFGHTMPSGVSPYTSYAPWSWFGGSGLTLATQPTWVGKNHGGITWQKTSLKIAWSYTNERWHPCNRGDGNTSMSKFLELLFLKLWCSCEFWIVNIFLWNKVILMQQPAWMVSGRVQFSRKLVI